MIDAVAFRKILKRLPTGDKVKMNVFGRLSIYDRSGRYKGYLDLKYMTFHLGHQPLSKYQKRLIKLVLAFLATYAFAHWFAL